MEAKYCIECKKLKPIASFGVSFKNVNAKNGYSQNESRKSRCKACYSLRDRLRKKARFIEMYGGKCICCGELDPRFLSLDHINNDGNVERQNLADYQIMARAILEYQPTMYQILCFNCNFGKSTNGGICPHKGQTLSDYLDHLNKHLLNLPDQPKSETEILKELLIQKMNKEHMTPENLYKLLSKS